MRNLQKKNRWGKAGSLWLNLAIIVFLISLGSASAYAKISINASIQKNVLRVGERSTLTISVSSDQGENLSHPQMPEIDGLYIQYAGESTSTNAVWSNGRFQRTDTLNIEYIVTALEEGKYTLSTIQVSGQNDPVKAKPIPITVLAGNAPSPTRAPGSLPSPQTETYGVIFVLQPNKTEAYVGEEIQLSCKVYIPTNREIRLQKLDDRSGQFQGFWTEIFDMTDKRYQRQVLLETSNGKLPYYEIPLKKYMLYPLKAGNQTIEPLSLQCQTPTRTRAGGFSLILGRMTPFSVNTEPVVINVKPLPENGKPETFKGAVGSSYRLESKVDSKEIKEGNTVSLIVSLAGEGNIRNVPPPVLPDLSKFEQYEPTKRENIQPSENGVTGQIEYVYPLIPHDVNSNHIGAVRFSYFNPQKVEYVTLETDPIDLTILPSGLNGFRGSGVASGNRRMIRRVGEDFRFNALSPLALSSVFLPLYLKPKYWFLLLTPIAVLLLAYIWKKQQDFYSGHPDALKSKKAPRLAGKLLAKAKSALQEGDTEQLYAALCKAITDYIDNRWNVATAGFTSEELKRLLIEKGIPPDHSQNVIRTLEEFDSARFSGEKRDPEIQKHDYSKAEQILASLMKKKSAS